jgi:hypothetical protein
MQDARTVSRTWLPLIGADHVGDDMTYRLHDVDPIGLAMDWLEACQRAQPAMLGELYAEAATFECECGYPAKRIGRASILDYWQRKLTAPPPRPFRLEQIWPETQGVALVYRYREPTLIRTSFRFDSAGKIEYSRCRQEPQIPFAMSTEITIRR